MFLTFKLTLLKKPSPIPIVWIIICVPSVMYFANLHGNNTYCLTTCIIWYVDITIDKWLSLLFQNQIQPMGFNSIDSARSVDVVNP